MSCKYTQWFIDKRVLVSGKDSILNTQNPLEIGLLPNKGITDDVLVKCSNRDYHTRWDNFSNLITPLLPTLLTGLFTFQNGLTESPLLTAEWGGTLLRDTTINGNSLYFVTFIDLSDFSLNATSGDINISADSQSINLNAGFDLILEASNNIFIRTPSYNLKTNGSILQLINSGTGNVDYTPYALPLADGAVNQILVTNGVGVVSWTTVSPKCEVLYFTDNPLNTSYSANGIGDIELATYSMPANTLSSNGSYIEIDLQLQITGLGGFGTESPEFAIDFRGLGSSIIFQHLNGVSYIQTIKVRIYRVSNTTHYSTGTSEIFDPITFQTTTNYINNISGLVTFSNIIIFDLNLILNATSDHIVELKHFTITKYLK
jgi:hypothetical protein